MADLNEEIVKFKGFEEDPQFMRFKQRPIAYFCAEYALEGVRPMYSGGLGVLAGDVIREAEDRNLPMVGIGLFYRNGYVCGSKEVGGGQIELCDIHAPENYGFEQVVINGSGHLDITVPIHDHNVKVRVWRRKDSKVPGCVHLRHSGFTQPFIT